MPLRHLFRLVLLSLFFNTFLMANTLRIAAASNVSYAIDALKKEFERSHPKTKLQVILGSSGKLTAQIKNRAPYAVFLSADMQYPEALYKDNFAIEKPRVYAKGTLALFSVKKQDFSKGLALLLEPNIKKIAIANPKTAPYGKAAKEALEEAKLYNLLKTKFVFASSISQTVSYAVTASDIGIVAASLLYSSQMEKYKQHIHWSLVDPRLYAPIEQGIVLLKNAGSSKEAQAFYDFMFSTEAQTILGHYGYAVP